MVYQKKKGKKANTILFFSNEKYMCQLSYLNMYDFKKGDIFMIYLTHLTILWSFKLDKNIKFSVKLFGTPVTLVKMGKTK